MNVWYAPPMPVIESIMTTARKQKSHGEVEVRLLQFEASF